jgi:hypothetical protein
VHGPQEEEDDHREDHREGGQVLVLGEKELVCSWNNFTRYSNC